MLLASLFFASMGVCIKFASVHFNSFEIVAYRGLVGVLFLIGFTRMRGVTLGTSVPMMHFWRSVSPGRRVMAGAASRSNGMGSRN